MSDIAGNTEFKVTNTKLYITIVNLSTKDNVKLTKQLSEGFKRLVYWNEYKTKIESKEADDNLTRLYLYASFQGVKRLFPVAFDNTDYGVKENVERSYFLPRVNITNYNVVIDGRTFYDQPINDQITKYDEIRKVAIRQRDGYTTGCLLDYQHLKDHYQLILMQLMQLILVNKKD